MRATLMSVLGCCTLTALAARGTVIHNEAVDGDLSTNAAAPTPLVFAAGLNEVMGRVTASNDVRDYFTFSVPASHTLTGVFLVSFIDVASGGNGNRSYMMIDDGTTSVVPSVSTMLQFLGGTHVDRLIAPLPTTNMLPFMAAASAGGTGFTAPLPPGAYTICLQQANAILTAYTLGIEITADAASCPGDINNDGFVDDSDFVLFAAAYDLLDCADPSMPAGCPADLNGDDFVDDSDFVEFAAAYDALLCP